ncbi:unnamed protein product [Brassica rapa subsp. narinosa]
MSMRAILSLVVLVLLIGSHESTPISDALKKLEDLFAKILGQSDDVLSFARFTQKYGKKYQNKEEIKHRFSVFQENLDLIGSTNKKGLPFKLGVNKFADLTNQEFLRNKFDCSRFGIFKGRHNVTDTTTIPSAKDWTKAGIVSPVRDQGQCEAGWAISSVGAVEAAYRKKYPLGRISLSEQQLLDCSTTNTGCDGGAAANAFQYNVERKVNYQAAYPYRGTQGKCRYEPLLVGKLIKSYGVGVGFDENKLKQWVASIGPVTVGFHVTNSFAFYEEGVYTSDECGDTTEDLNHFMLVVGYGVEDGVPYWLIQNSWGADWGEKGYIKVEMGKNMCGKSFIMEFKIYNRIHIPYFGYSLQNKMARDTDSQILTFWHLGVFMFVVTYGLFIYFLFQRLIEMEFCPTCGNLLRYGQSQFFCSTCPYIARIERQVEIKKKQLLVKKSIDPVVKKDDIPKGPETEAPCPRCGHDKAYFKTMQIRSADEPESRFYRCVKCEQTWREE